MFKQEFGVAGAAAQASLQGLRGVGIGGSGRDVTRRTDVTHAWGNNSIAFNSRLAAAGRDEAA